MKDYIKIRLVPAMGTDLICICCFGFRTEYALQPNTPGITPCVGLHKTCYDDMHARRTPSGSSEEE